MPRKVVRIGGVLLLVGVALLSRSVSQTASHQSGLATLSLPVGSPVASPLPERAFIIRPKYLEADFLASITSFVLLDGPIVDEASETVITPHGRFAVLELELTNLGTLPQPRWEEHLLHLQDDQGRHFFLAAGAAQAWRSQHDLEVTSWEPGVRHRTALVYDVAMDARSFLLGIQTPEHTTETIPLTLPGWAS